MLEYSAIEEGSALRAGDGWLAPTFEPAPTANSDRQPLHHALDRSKGDPLKPRRQSFLSNSRFGEPAVRIAGLPLITAIKGHNNAKEIQP